MQKSQCNNLVVREKAFVALCSIVPLNLTHSGPRRQSKALGLLLNAMKETISLPCLISTFALRGKHFKETLNSLYFPPSFITPSLFSPCRYAKSFIVLRELSFDFPRETLLIAIIKLLFTDVL